MTEDMVKKYPDSWVVVPLGQSVESEKGKKPNSQIANPDTEYRYPYIDIQAFEDGTIRHWTNGEGCRFCSEDDLLMVWDGSRSGLVGKGMNGALGSTLARINFPAIENDYAYYFLQSKYLEINSRAKGSGTPHVDPDLLWNCELPIPPLNEQKRIVTRIEELFSELDNALESLTETANQLKVYRQAVLKHAFANIKKRVPLEEVSDAVGGYAFKSDSFSQEEGAYQVLRIGNIRPGIVREKEAPVFLHEVDAKVLNRYLLKKGDVLITLTGTRRKRDYGYTAIVDKDNYLINQRLAYLRFNNSYLPQFFLYFSWTEDFKRQFFGSETGNVGQGNVGMKAIRSTLVPMLDVSEQSQVVNEIESKLSVLDTLEATMEDQMQKARILRHAILSQAYTGMLVEQDPTDEPASALLERIKARKGNSNKKTTNAA